MTDYPMTENPMTENPTTKNTINKEYKELKNKKIYTHELFDEFWKEYPKKLDKPKAKRAFASALKRAKFEEILAGAIQYRNDPNRVDEYTKFPATWLNNDAWENGPLPERQKKRTGKTDWDALDRFVKEKENESE